MNIETKFNIGDPVYFLDDNEMAKGLCSISLEKSSLRKTDKNHQRNELGK